MNKNDFPTKNARQTVNTTAGGAAYQAFANELCTFARVHNRNAVDIEVQIDAAGATIIVPAKGFKNIFGVDNLSRLGVRRVDVSAVQVPVEAEALV